MNSGDTAFAVVSSRAGFAGLPAFLNLRTRRSRLVKSMAAARPALLMYLNVRQTNPGYTVSISRSCQPNPNYPVVSPVTLIKVAIANTEPPVPGTAGSSTAITPRSKQEFTEQSQGRRQPGKKRVAR